MLIRSERGHIYNFDHIVSVELNSERMENGKARFFINAHLAGELSQGRSSASGFGVAELAHCDNEAEAKQIMQKILRNDRHYLDLTTESKRPGEAGG